MSLGSITGAKWKYENVIYIFTDDEDRPIAHIVDSHEQLEDLQDVVTINRRIKKKYFKNDAKIKKIYYYKEKSGDIEAAVTTMALVVGSVGCIVVAGAIKAGPEADRENEAIAKAARIGIGILGGIITAAGAITCLTKAFFAFHAFLVFECYDGLWVSVEKNDERIAIQIGRSREEVTRYKNGKQSNPRNEVEVLREFNIAEEVGNPGLTIQEFLKWVINSEQNEKKFNLLIENCKDLAKDVIKEFAANPENLPRYEDLLWESFVKAVMNAFGQSHLKCE